jgi:hypothetical protein
MIHNLSSGIPFWRTAGLFIQNTCFYRFLFFIFSRTIMTTQKKSILEAVNGYRRKLAARHKGGIWVISAQSLLTATGFSLSFPSCPCISTRTAAVDDYRRQHSDDCGFCSAASYRRRRAFRTA